MYTTITQIGVLNEDCVKFQVPILYTFGEISRERPFIRGWFINLNDSTGPKMIIHLYLIFFRFFLKVLERNECRQADPYMTANRNFVRFAHS